MASSKVLSLRVSVYYVSLNYPFCCKNDYKCHNDVASSKARF